jgi:hypothetical protein
VGDVEGALSTCAAEPFVAALQLGRIGPALQVVGVGAVWLDRQPEHIGGVQEKFPGPVDCEGCPHINAGHGSQSGSQAVLNRDLRPGLTFECSQAVAQLAFSMDAELTPIHHGPIAWWRLVQNLKRTLFT